MRADMTLDTLGYFCPMPIIMTSKKIKELTLGQVLAVLSDDEGIKKDMPAWCETTGHALMGITKDTLIDGIDQFAGVTTYLAEAKQGSVNLFI